MPSLTNQKLLAFNLVIKGEIVEKNSFIMKNKKKKSVCEFIVKCEGARYI